MLIIFVSRSLGNLIIEVEFVRRVVMFKSYVSLIIDCNWVVVKGLMIFFNI